MKIELERLNKQVHFRAKNEDGVSLDMDGSPEIGGENQGLRPMQLLLAGIGGCSSIDIIEILKKQRQELEDIKITVTAEREKDKVPSLFTTIHVHYQLWGNLDETKAQKAITLSMEKYCSVAKIIEKTAEITYSFEIKN